MAELSSNVFAAVENPESLEIGVTMARVASRAIDLGRVGARDAQDAMHEFLSGLGARFGVMRADWTVEIASPLLRDDLDVALTSNFQDLLSESGRGAFATRALTALAEGRAFVGDADVTLGDAQLVWECRIRAGAGDRLYVAARDVTAERRRDAHLAREQEALDLIENNAPVGRWRMSTEDGGLTFSMSALKLLNYSDEEALIGSADARDDLVHLEALALRALAEKRPAINRMVVSRGAGHARAVKAIATPAFRGAGEPASTIGLLIEETSGKASAANAAEKRRTDVALTLARATIFEIDVITGHACISGSWRDIFTDRSEFRVERENRDWVWSIFHPEDRPAALALWKAHLEHCTPFKIRHRVARLDNREQWLMTFAKAYFENGKMTRVTGLMQDVTPATEAEPEQIAPLAPARRRALGVEPNTRNRDVLRQMLERSGLDAEIVGDGRSAMHAVAASKFDLIVVDAATGPDALDMVRAVRAGLAAPMTSAATPIVLTVPSIAVSLAADYERAGASERLAKPFRPSDLEKAIARATETEWT